MRFSIIVPVYNAERYIDKLLQSVLSQTYEDYELILVDDGSQDRSYSVIKKYQDNDKRIKVYRKENTGPGLTRKYGFEKATGELIFFVDSDDWITSTDVLQKVNTIFETNSEIDVLFFDREDIIGKKRNIIVAFEEIKEGIHSVDEINEEIRPGLGAKILRRDILTSEMFYESTVYEDLYTTYEYLEKCNKFYYSSSCFYTIYHEEESTSLSSNETENSFLKTLEMILLVYSKTKRKSLRRTLEYRMASLFTHYWKIKITDKDICKSNLIKKNIRIIVGILKNNKVKIKSHEKKRIKAISYRILLFIS